MSYGCLSPKLNGKPHTVITRVYNVPSEELLKRLPSIQPFVISELMGEGLKRNGAIRAKLISHITSEYSNPAPTLVTVERYLYVILEV